MSKRLPSFLINLSLLLSFFCLAEIGWAQTIESQTDNAFLAELIKKIERKAKITKAVALNEYQSNFRWLVELEGQNKRINEVYEEYCVKTDHTFCRMVLIEKDGAALPAKKIEKARRKAAKEFTDRKASDGRGDSYGYGVSISSIWVDPVIYLRACRIAAFSEKIIEGRAMALVRVDNCNTANEAAVMSKQLAFMAKTEAEITIDVADESVAQMLVYPAGEFALESKPNVPIIISENMRMPDGYWFTKRTRLETIGNKNVFPTLMNNWEFQFFGYRRLTVDVGAPKYVDQDEL